MSLVMQHQEGRGLAGGLFTIFLSHFVPSPCFPVVLRPALETLLSIRFAIFLEQRRATGKALLGQSGGPL
jgi:hypothetical protein